MGENEFQENLLGHFFLLEILAFVCFTCVKERRLGAEGRPPRLFSRDLANFWDSGREGIGHCWCMAWLNQPQARMIPKGAKKGVREAFQEGLEKL